MLEGLDTHTAQTKKIYRLKSYPASLLHKPSVKLLSDDLQNPSYNHSDVLQVIGSQRLKSNNRENED